MTLVVGTATGQTAPDSVAAAPRYAAVAAMLERFIAHEMADKRLNALSISLVEDQRVVWARGFGFANPRDVETRLRDMFDWVYKEYDYAVFPMTIHPDVSGHPELERGSAINGDTRATKHPTEQRVAAQNAQRCAGTKHRTRRRHAGEIAERQ